MKKPATLDQIEKDLISAFRSLPRERRKITFEKLMKTLKTPVGKLGRKHEAETR